MSNLVDYLKRCDDAYYNTGNPIVTDETYDALVETLRRLDPHNEYLMKIGAKVRTNKLGRVIPMGTLEKYHADDEIKKWLESEGDSILISPKYDGFAVELIYKRGVLVSAGTRGDGNVGEDVLKAVVQIQNIPTTLSNYPKDDVIIRGEAIIPTKNHSAIKELGYEAMRNAVPGIVRSNRVDALKYVDFVAYEFFDGNDDRVLQREYWKDQFTVEDYTELAYDEFSNMEEIRESFRNHTYSYELDGVVLKTKIIKEDDLLHPSHMIAWKYKSNRKTTVLREIEFNVGATGSISVVGIFDPVEFQGASLSRASFGSLDLYRKMKPAIGDLIEVSRRGDIIPWIEGVVVGDPENFQDLYSCPCCGSPLKDDKCVNIECPDRVKLKLLQYIQTLKVKGIGQSLINALVTEGYIKNLTDIYTMDTSLILTLPRQGQSAVDKWEVLKEKSVTPLEFLCAYPIENSGKAIWTSLLDRYTVKELLELSVEDLMEAKIKGLGESKVTSIITQLKENKSEILSLINTLGL